MRGECTFDVILRLLACLSSGLCPCVCARAPQALSSGVFELKIDSFISARPLCLQQPGDCRLFFRVCLKHVQHVSNPGTPCTYGNASTEVIGVNSIPGSAPVRVPFVYKWPVSGGNPARRRETADPTDEVFS